MIFQIQDILKGVNSGGSIDREYLDHEKNDFAHGHSEPELFDDENDKICNIPTEEHLIRDKLVKAINAFFDQNNFISFKGKCYSKHLVEKTHANDILPISIIAQLESIFDGKRISFFQTLKR